MAKLTIFVDGQIVTAANLNTITPDVPAAGDPLDTDWVPLTYEADFEPQGSGTPRIRRTGMTVELRGLVKPTAGTLPTNNTTVVIIPPEFVPAEWLYRATTGQAMAVNHRQIITTGGQVQIAVSASGSAWCSISQVWLLG
jgi:hypothetical protein